MKRRTHKQILADLMKKNVVPQEVRDNSSDLEEAIVAAGGNAGSVRNG